MDTMETELYVPPDSPRASMPDELCHPYSNFSNWKFKLFRVRSLEKAPLPNEPPLEKEAELKVSEQADGLTVPSSIMKLCLGGKNKENVEGAGRQVDLKLQEIDTHMDHLRALCRLCGILLRKSKGPEHEVQGDLDDHNKYALRRMGCKASKWPDVILKL
ncbi:hypothetical protein HF521_001479 [Silurus meridionalis]|uniref:RAG1 importin-binding domain-containing protein n=1 Tax=Silurus meridionalis TaxID=175797 RepID=A0A8T0B692_SILME|nr:hypothetical protein HF521_001479 [Silurus meridionalis]